MLIEDEAMCSAERFQCPVRMLFVALCLCTNLACTHGFILYNQVSLVDPIRVHHPSVVLQ